MPIDPAPFQPDWVSPPGDTITTILDDRGMSRLELSLKVGKSQEFVASLIAGKEKIDDDLAQKLSEVLGATKRFWLNRDQNYWADKQRLGL